MPQKSSLLIAFYYFLLTNCYCYYYYILGWTLGGLYLLSYSIYYCTFLKSSFFIYFYVNYYGDCDLKCDYLMLKLPGLQYYFKLYLFSPLRIMLALESLWFYYIWLNIFKSFCRGCLLGGWSYWTIGFESSSTPAQFNLESVTVFSCKNMLWKCEAVLIDWPPI